MCRHRPGGNLACDLVVVTMLLLVYIDETHRQISAARNVYTLEQRIEINAVHAASRWKMREFLARPGVHDNHFGRHASSDEQSRCRLVKCRIAWPLATHGPSGNDLPSIRVDYLELVGDRNENEKCRP